LQGFLRIFLKKWLKAIGVACLEGSSNNEIEKARGDVRLKKRRPALYAAQRPAASGSVLV